jgi:predicted metal-dependent phosphoesterase TrpH
MKLAFYLSLMCFSINVNIGAQDHHHMIGKPMSFPDVPGYVTLKVDLHQHTVFSDGSVWPNIRVQEALRDSLDAISLTEHLEYQPHKADIPHPDRNRSYEIALSEARNHKLMILSGSEITRSAPVGHSNAIFIDDANKLLAADSLSPFLEAKKQGAFVFWNHPAWFRQSSTGNPILSDFQLERIKNGELHGIEVINEDAYAEESLALALKHNLTILGTSDIHGLIDWNYKEKGHHRPITLVFAKERSVSSIKEALFAGRTVAVYNSLLVGKEEYIKPLLNASIKIKHVSYLDNTEILKVELENTTSSDLVFENTMPYTFYKSSPVFTILANSSHTLNIKTLTKKEEVILSLKALTAFTAPKKQPVINWLLEVPD